jgi:hypothetical protein
MDSQLPQVVNPADLFVSPAQLHYTRPKTPPRQSLVRVLVPDITDEELDMKPAAHQRVKESAERSEEAIIPYDMLLLSLSEEYIEVAHRLGPRVALISFDTEDQKDLELFETYTKLIAAALGCLEAALKVSCFPSLLP